MPPDFLFSRPLDVLYGLTTLASFLVGFPGNCFALRHFLLKKKDPATSIYLAIALNDAVICCLALPISISYFSWRTPGVLESEGACYTWGILCFLAMRLSVVLTMLLSVVRTTSLVFPFTRTPVRAPVVAICCFIVFMAAQMLFVVLVGFRISFSKFVVGCMWSAGPELGLRTTSTFEVLMILTYVVPVILVVFGCVASSVVLLSSRSLGQLGNNTVRQQKRRATVTIIIFTVVYLACNIPQAVSVVLQTIGVHSNWEVDLLKFDYSHPPYLFYFKNFITFISSSLNSMINPVIYAFR